MREMTAQTIETRPAENRLERLGHARPSRKKPLTELDAKARLLLSYLVYGCPHPYVSQITRASPTEDDPDRRRPLEQGEPMRLEEAADLLRIRRRYARWISSQTIFQRELAKALQQMRDGHRAEALTTIAGIMRDPGDGSAAFQKVRLQAAKEILGDQIGPPPRDPVTVNVGVQLSAGLVIRLPPGVAVAPLERGDQRGAILEHDTAPADPETSP